MALYQLSTFLSAFLLFLVQPMLARAVLPHFGGAAFVWAIVLAFCQIGLLLGYFYAFALDRWVAVRRQPYVHLCAAFAVVALLPLPILPLVAGAAPGSPAWSLLGLLGRGALIPFVFLATTGPLLQRWYASSTLENHQDPYFLYVASNAGSLLALLCYPVLVEPFVPLPDRCGFGAWAVGC